MKHALSQHLSRRALLGAAGGALALPLLDIAGPRQAAAQNMPAFPKRFVVFFTSNGTIADHWNPSGTETDFVLSEILAPLAPHRNDIVVIQGVDQQGGGGDGHQSGIGGMLTGNLLNPGPFRSGGYSAGWASSISVDQQIANEIGQYTRFSSLELGVECGTADDWGRMCYAGSDEPVPPDDDPNSVFARVFGELSSDPAALTALRTHRKSVLDGVLARYQALAARVGAADRQKLEVHASTIRDIEIRLDAQAVPSASCLPPSVDASIDLTRNDSFPAIGKLQMDMLVMALACDLTRVASLQWSRALSVTRFSWLGITDDHHTLSHRPDDDLNSKNQLVQINHWYMTQLAYLLDRMKQIPEGEGTLLDNTVVFVCNELAKGNVHGRTDAPYLLAGRAGGSLRTGRYLQYAGDVPHNNLLVSLLNVMGIEATTFGKPDWCTGPLANLSG